MSGPVMSPVIYAGLPETKRIMFKMGVNASDPRRIIDVACSTLGADPALIASPSRKQELVHSRHIAIFIILSLNTGMSLKRLGKIFNRDHSTMIASRDFVKNLYGFDKEFTAKVDLVKQNL